MKRNEKIKINKELKYFLIYFVFQVIVVFAFNNKISLWDQDEAAYAGFGKTMVSTGNWLIPDFMWSDVHKKPPLHFWNIAMSYSVFGINEFSVRFSSALAILFTYLLVFFGVKRLFGNKISLISVIVLSTTLLVPLLAKMGVTDATLLFFTTLSAFCIIDVIKNRSSIAVLIFWISFSLALLVKGPPIILFTAIFAGILLIFHPNRKNLIIFHPWFFLPIALIPLFFWGYETTKVDNGAFVNWLLDFYILKRVNGGIHNQVAPPGTHLLYITLFFIPYFMFFPKAFWTGIRGIFKDKNENLILGAWMVAGWLLYEFSSTKLPAYCVAAHVPLAILIAKTIYEFLQKDIKPKKGLIIAQFSVLLLITVALLVAGFYLHLSTGLKITLVVFNFLMVWGILSAIKKLRNNTLTDFIYSVFIINIIFQIGIFVAILPQVDYYKNSTKRVAEYIKNNAVKESTIVIGNTVGHPPSLPFYIGLNFNDIVEEKDSANLSNLYKSKRPCVFVLDNQQINELSKNNPHLKVEEITSFFTDRKGKSNYYILKNY